MRGIQLRKAFLRRQRGKLFAASLVLYLNGFKIALRVSLKVGEAY